MKKHIIEITFVMSVVLFCMLGLITYIDYHISSYVNQSVPEIQQMVNNNEISKHGIASTFYKLRLIYKEDLKWIQQR